MELSQHQKGYVQPSRADELLQSALLFHQSTADETWAKVANTSWLAQYNEDGPVREGLGLAQEGIFLSDLIEQLIEEAEMSPSTQRRFPTLSKQRYVEALESIWHLLSALQYWEGLSSVEKGGYLDLAERDEMLEKMLSKLKMYRADPEAYIRGDYESIKPEPA